MIALYDLEDNLITIFDTYEECAKYFNTTYNAIKSHISRAKYGHVDKKRDIKNHKWYRLIRMESE